MVESIHKLKKWHGTGGVWPEGFIIPKGTIFPSGWQCFLAFKITDAWMKYMLVQIREE